MSEDVIALYGTSDDHEARARARAALEQLHEARINQDPSASDVVRQADGYVRFVDRLKDAIRRRGETISSFEVGQVLLSHPAVANAAVFPVRSSLAEDEVMAALVLHPGRVLMPADLIAYWCRACPILPCRGISNS